MESVVEGEPPFKRRKQPLRAPTVVAPCNLSLSLWWELILKHRLTLRDLIAIKRTCLAFATFKLLRRYIKDKEYSAFGSIDRIYWDKATRVTYFSAMDSQWREFRENNYGRFLLFYEAYGFKYFAVYSNKSVLWNVFLELYNGNCTLTTMFMVGYCHFYRCTLSNKGVSVIYIQGLNNELRAFVKQ